MKMLVVLLTLVATVAAIFNPHHDFRMSSPYRYVCAEDKCMRQLKNAPPEDKHYATLSECSLVCGQYGSLWPRPSKDVIMSQETTLFAPHNMKFTKLSANNPVVHEMLTEQAHYFMRNLHFLHPLYCKTSKGPFSDYQQAIDNRDPERSFRNAQFGRFSHIDHFNEGKAENHRFDLFDLRYKLQKRQHEKQSQDQNQEFRSSFRRHERYGIEQMRYVKISPFNHNSSPIAEKQHFNIEITVNGDETQLGIDTDESYDLNLLTTGATTTATIVANTYYGARHAMETLSQMVVYDERSNSLRVVKTAKISDEPAFKYRGIMLDTARNFYPKEEIMSLMDSMATNKLNTFHWHITDAASFPMYSERQPQMTHTGAYSPRQIYYPQDVREIVEYANQRGIRVVPELAAPAHAGAGWKFGEQEGLGKLVLCNEPDDIWFLNCKEPICGQLNPTNPQVYEVLKNVYSDILESFNPEFLHMGGADTSFNCWKNSPEITSFLTSQNREVGSSQELFELWNTFQITAFNKLSESVKETGHSKVTPMIYSSSFVKNFVDPEQYVVQITGDVTNSIQEYIFKGYKVILSDDTWSFEGPAPSWPKATHKDIPEPHWMQVYESRSMDMLTGLNNQKEKSNVDQVLGGEAMVFSYETDAESLQSTVWPRGAAFAERLWTNPSRGEYQAEKTAPRLAAHRERMVNRGTRAEAFQPEYCFQNQKSCYTQGEYQNRQNQPHN